MIELGSAEPEFWNDFMQIYKGEYKGETFPLASGRCAIYI